MKFRRITVDFFAAEITMNYPLHKLKNALNASNPGYSLGYRHTAGEIGSWESVEPSKLLKKLALRINCLF